MYYVYMLRCKDNSIYTGITTNLDRRFNEHIAKDKKCAKYTAHHDVLKIECAWTCETRSLASKLEYAIKKLAKQEKELLIVDESVFQDVFKNLNVEEYIRQQIEE